jgi:ELWxxDGT repeat protein
MTTDGTAAGTQNILEKPLLNIQCQKKFDEKLIFKANDFTSPGELWVSDGTAAGTYAIQDKSGKGITFPCGFDKNNDLIYFSGDSGLGQELFVTDGKSNDMTKMLLDIIPGSDGASGVLNVFKGKVFFVAKTPDKGNELWVTDGTTIGTTLFKDLFDGSGSSNPDKIIQVGDWGYFTASDATKGRELWRTDGTPQNTEVFIDLVPGIADGEITYVFNINEKLIIYNRTAISGYEF